VAEDIPHRADKEVVAWWNKWCKETIGWNLFSLKFKKTHKKLQTNHKQTKMGLPSCAQVASSHCLLPLFKFAFPHSFVTDPFVQPDGITEGSFLLQMGD
jgi:hypothetical protein